MYILIIKTDNSAYICKDKQQIADILKKTRKTIYNYFQQMTDNCYESANFTIYIPETKYIKSKRGGKRGNF